MTKPKPPQMEMLQIQEMLQAAMQDMNMLAIVELVATTAQATADSTADRHERARLLWFAKRFRQLSLGPPTSLGEPRGPRPTGREALQLALSRLVIRANKVQELSQLPPDDLEWVDRLVKELGGLATRMEM